jgi:hypothetical protein
MTLYYAGLSSWCESVRASQVFSEKIKGGGGCPAFDLQSGSWVAFSSSEKVMRTGYVAGFPEFPSPDATMCNNYKH